MTSTRSGRHSKPHSTMPWWGHVLVLTLILGGTVASILTANPLCALILVPVAWFIGARLKRAAVFTAWESR